MAVVTVAIVSVDKPALSCLRDRPKRSAGIRGNVPLAGHPTTPHMICPALAGGAFSFTSGALDFKSAGATRKR
jgi:hypothetical protein